MKKGTKRLILFTAASAAAIYAYNTFVEKTATSKNMLSDEYGSYFNWKYGEIYYTKRGSGSPILLLHDLSPDSSSFEWAKLMKKLERNHTVYTLDLLGCGRSDKPAMIYTNYLYVQLITAFVKEVIEEKTDVIATNLSTSFVITADNMDKDLFHKIILINPPSIKEIAQVIDDKAKLKNTILSLPVIGTFVYNIMMNPKQIGRKFENEYYLKGQFASQMMQDVYYEAAHLYESEGRYLFGSILGRYMNFDIRHSLNQVDSNLYIISSRDRKRNVQATEEYLIANKNVEITYISGANLLPQLEIPEKFISVLKSILEKEET